jgi:hypothetical protein
MADASTPSLASCPSKPSAFILASSSWQSFTCQCSSGRKTQTIAFLIVEKSGGNVHIMGTFPLHSFRTESLKQWLLVEAEDSRENPREDNSIKSWVFTVNKTNMNWALFSFRLGSI